MAYGLGCLVKTPGFDCAVVEAVGVIPDPASSIAEKGDDAVLGLRSEFAYGRDAFLLQQRRRCFPREHEVGDRQGPEDVFIVIRRYDCRGVGLFVIRTHLGKDLVVGNADGNGDAYFFLHPRAQPVGQFPFGETVELRRSGHVEVRFVDRRRFDVIGVFVVDRVDFVRDFLVKRVMRRHEYDVRTLLPRLPYGVRRLDSRLLCQLIFGHDDTHAVLRIAGHRHGYVPERRISQTLTRGVEVVAVTMKDKRCHKSVHGL